MRVFIIGIVAVLSAAAPARADNARLLDVPFVPQSELLCGGAAVSMVMRYWAATEIYAEDFAALVDERAGGISVGALARAAGERGWQAHAFAARAGDVDAHIARGQPLIALIEDRPGRLHYVVIVASANGRVVFHDPAANPFRSMDAAAFDRAWHATGRTTLLVLPPPGAGPIAGTAYCDRTPCNGACPHCGNRLRDDAGRLFLARRYGDAASLAQLVVADDPADLASWQLLAASRYLEGDPAGALDAWNTRQEPRVDLARIEGLSRTRYDIVAGALDLPPRTLLTRDALARAERRVAEMPSVQLSRVSYSPRENGVATVDVAVVERPLLPTARAELVAASVYAATMREARVNVTSPSGNGEVWTAAARWWSGRPRVALSLASPRLGSWTGRWQLDGFWERQTYATAGGHIESERRHAGMSFADWTSGRTRLQLSAAVDRWNDGAAHLSIGGDVERRLAGDRLAIGLATSASARFATGSIAARWRSSREEFSGLRLWTTAAAVTRSTPLDLWLAGDTGVARATLLRAHPLIDDGVIDAARLTRALAHATLELQRPLTARPFARFGWAAFVDATQHDVDAGAGLRVKLPGAPGAVRIDLARGLRDGRVALSAGWQPAW